MWILAYISLIFGKLTNSLCFYHYQSNRPYSGPACTRVQPKGPWRAKALGIIQNFSVNFSRMVAIDSIWKRGGDDKSAHIPQEALHIPPKKSTKNISIFPPRLSQLFLDGREVVSETWGSPRECSYPSGFPRDALGIPATRPGSYRIEGVIHQTGRLIILTIFQDQVSQIVWTIWSHGEKQIMGKGKGLVKVWHHI